MAKLDFKLLNQIIEQVTDIIQQSREESFEIREMAQAEFTNTRTKLSQVAKETAATSEQVEEVERLAREDRSKLAAISKQYNAYSEAEIQAIYQQASTSQAALLHLRQRAADLSKRQAELEYTQQYYQKLVQRAEAFITQARLAVNFLTDNWANFAEQLHATEDWQRLAAQIISAQEEERRRVAREIHDGPAQALANMVIRVDLCERLIERDPEAMRQEFAQLRAMTKATLQEIRKIIFDLRPMALDDLGLVAAIRRYTDILRERSELDVTVVVQGAERRLPKEMEVVLFRIVQEALQNVYKHAQSPTAFVKLEFTPDMVRGSITDEGKGFEVEKVQRGFGLLSMRERIELCRGELSIASKPGQGTRVEFRVSVPKG